MRAIDKIYKLLKEAENNKNAIAGYIPYLTASGGVGFDASLFTSIHCSLTGYSVLFEQSCYNRPEMDKHLLITPSIHGLERVTDEKLAEDSMRFVNELMTHIETDEVEEVHINEPKRIEEAE